MQVRSHDYRDIVLFDERLDRDALVLMNSRALLVDSITVIASTFIQTHNELIGRNASADVPREGDVGRFAEKVSEDSSLIRHGGQRIERTLTDSESTATLLFPS